MAVSHGNHLADRLSADQDRRILPSDPASTIPAMRCLNPLISSLVAACARRIRRRWSGFRPWGRDGRMDRCSSLIASGGLRLPLAGVLLVAAAAVWAGEGVAPGPADPAVFGIELSSSDYEHWSFRPISRPAVPMPVANAEWVANPIDA